MTIRKLETLYEDDHIVIINKPASLLSVPDRYRSNMPSLKSMLRKHYGDIFVLHRLDFETSGVIVYGKHLEVQQRFTEMQINNEVDKLYLAVCQGIPAIESGRIDVPLYYDFGKTYVAKEGDKRGKEAATLYRIKEEFGNISLIECKLISGRTHQIRVHFQYAGFPLLVDKKYSSRSEIYLSEFKKKKYRKGIDHVERPLIARQTLHASRITFSHPITKEKIDVEAEMPKDMRALINQLRKNRA